MSTPAHDESSFARRWLARGLWLAAALAGVIALVVILTRPSDRTVPPVIGQDFDTAVRILGDDGFRVHSKRISSASPSNQILAQSPRAGAHAAKGAKITLSVSAGPTQVIVPDVSGKKTAEAKSLLEGAGFTVLVVKSASTSAPMGAVASTSPKALSSLSRGGQVTVVESTGPERIKVPNVSGQSSASAESQLAHAGLKVVVVEQESSVPAGQVISQTPAAGKRVARGAAARVFVAATPPKVSLPDVTNTDVEAAVTSLSTLGLTIQFHDVTVNAAQDRLVRSQQPTGGTSVGKGSAVTLTIGRRR